jgi:hypothetical protein
MLLVELFLVLFIQSEMLADFLRNDFLSDDLVAQVLLEFFVGSALGFRRFFQFLHAAEVHLLAHFVEALDEFGVAGDAEVFALLQQKLLVDQVAQDVALLVCEIAIGVRGILLRDFLLQLIAAANVFRAGDDLVIYPGDNLFDHGVGWRQNGQQQRGSNRQQQGKSDLLH